MPFTLRRLLRWDDPALRDLNVMFDELSREIAPEQGSIAAGQPGVQVTDKFVSEFGKSFTVSGTVAKPDRVAHGLGVKPSWVGVTPIDVNTASVYLPREPDDEYVYLAVPVGAGIRKVWIKAEV